MNGKLPRVALIVPCHNEEEVVESTSRALTAVLHGLAAEGLAAPDGVILFIDDGSVDATWEKISLVASVSEGSIRGVRLSRRYGHQEALLAGLETMLGEAEVMITLDADLQDDVAVIPEMMRLYLDGADVVYGVRDNRASDSWLKKSTARCFYSSMRRLGAECVADHADFRLLSSRAVADLMEYGERNIFLRGIVPLLGYRQECVYYTRKLRMAGESKYPFGRMLDFAINGITSFSVRPVRMLFWMGLAFMLTALGIGIYVLIRHFTGETIEGWTSLMLSIWFCTGILLIGLGIIGEYIGKIYIEVKRRPRYRISDTV